MISLKEKGILLTKAYEDEIEQEANGKYQLSFKYPTSDDHWKAISPGALILADDLHGEQEFRVFEVTKRHGYLYVYAEQVANDLNWYSISSIGSPGSQRVMRWASKAPPQMSGPLSVGLALNLAVCSSFFSTSANDWPPAR